MEYKGKPKRFIIGSKYVTNAELLDSTHKVGAKKAFSFVAELDSLLLRKWINGGTGKGEEESFPSLPVNQPHYTFKVIQEYER